MRQTTFSHVRVFLSNTSTHAHWLQCRNSDFRLTYANQTAIFSLHRERPRVRRLNQRRSNVEPRSNLILISSAHEEIGVWTVVNPGSVSPHTLTCEWLPFFTRRVPRRVRAFLPSFKWSGNPSTARTWRRCWPNSARSSTECCSTTYSSSATVTRVGGRFSTCICNG